MKKRLWVIIIFASIGLVAAVSALLKGGVGIRCDYDGTRIQPIYEVAFTFEDSTEKQFCSFSCAVLDLKNEKKKVNYVTVVDEVTGSRIDALLAFFVKSDVFTLRHVKNNIHVFAKKEDALLHADQFNGVLIPNPLK